MEEREEEEEEKEGKGEVQIEKSWQAFDPFPLTDIFS